MPMPLCKQKEIEAKLIRRGDADVLVAAFQASLQPCVWHFNLAQNPDFSLQVIEQEGAWSLGFIAPQKPFVSVAQFVTRDEADAAFTAARRALMTRRHRPLRARWIVVLALVFLAFTLWPHGKAAVDAVVGDKLTSSIQQPLSTKSVQDKLEEGMPVSADDVLKPPAD
jgi:hypothetical protein